MQIRLNGEPYEVQAGTTLAALVNAISDEPRGIAIELNREIVPKSQHGAVILAEGDELEVVQFVGGG